MCAIRVLLCVGRGRTNTSNVNRLPNKLQRQKQPICGVFAFSIPTTAHPLRPMAPTRQWHMLQMTPPPIQAGLQTQLRYVICVFFICHKKRSILSLRVWCNATLFGACACTRSPPVHGDSSDSSDSKLMAYRKSDHLRLLWQVVRTTVMPSILYSGQIMAISALIPMNLY